MNQIDDIIREGLKMDLEPLYGDIPATAPLTVEMLNDAIWPPVTVFVAMGRAEELRERVEAELGDDGRRTITIEESAWITDTTTAYIFKGRVVR